jgi:hypothetical protein
VTSRCVGLYSKLVEAKAQFDLLEKYISFVLTIKLRVLTLSGSSSGCSDKHVENDNMRIA